MYHDNTGCLLEHMVEVSQELHLFFRKDLFMIYVGIDVASEKHDVCIMNEQGEIYGKKFQITNSKDEYKKTSQQNKRG